MSEYESAITNSLRLFGYKPTIKMMKTLLAAKGRPASEARAEVDNYIRQHPYVSVKKESRSKALVIIGVVTGIFLLWGGCLAVLGDSRRSSNTTSTQTPEPASGDGF